MTKTIFSNYSDTQLYCLFRSEIWHGTENSKPLDSFHRQQALQELHNRDAAKMGIEAVEVKATEMSGYGFYRHSGSTVNVSRSMIEEDCVYTNSGRPVLLPESNIRSMNTVFHEGWHSAQNQSENNSAVYGDDTQTQRDVIANLNNYINSDYDLYRIQISEREANNYANQKTMEAMGKLESVYGRDSRMVYFDGKIQNQYETSLKNAQIKYNDPDIEKNMQSAMNDNYYNGRVIQPNQKSSYYSVREILDNQEINRIKNSSEPDYERISFLENELKNISAAKIEAENNLKNTANLQKDTISEAQVQQSNEANSTITQKTNSNELPETNNDTLSSSESSNTAMENNSGGTGSSDETTSSSFEGISM